MRRHTNSVSSEIYRILKLNFGDLEVIDAKAPLRLQPMPCDLVGAVPKDPLRCLFRNTVARMYQATTIVFWQGVCYIDLIGGDGVRRVERFFLPKATHDFLVQFDAGEPLELGRSFMLKAPKGTATLKNTQRRIRAYRRTSQGRIVNKAHTARAMLHAAMKRAASTKTKLRAAKQTEKAKSPVLQAAIKDDQVAQARVRVTTALAKRCFIEANKISKRVTYGGRKHKKFDLTTRRGSRGNYNFVDGSAVHQ